MIFSGVWLKLCLYRGSAPDPAGGNDFPQTPSGKEDVESLLIEMFGLVALFQLSQVNV